MFSSSSKDIVINPLHSRIPLNNIPQGVWINLSIDVLSFVAECFKNQTFRSIEFISLSADCKIRRIFSMRSSLPEYDRNLSDEFPLEYAEILPRTLALPNTVQQENINYNIERVKISNESDLKSSKEYLNSNNIINSNVKENVTKLNKQKISNFNNNKPTSNKIPNKNNNGELLNKQEFIIENYQMNFDLSKSKSPEKETKTITKPNRIQNKTRNTKKPVTNVKKPNEITAPQNITETKSNILLNTLNYKNIDKWDNSNVIGDSIEEIYEVEHKNDKNEERG